MSSRTATTELVRVRRLCRSAAIVVIAAFGLSNAICDDWAFTTPKRPTLPKVKSASSNPIDAFISERTEAAGITLSPMADRRVLIRRLTFDLLGLPPTPEEIEAFVSDRSPDAYRRLIDRLLASQHYGERWARLWLDLVRYADSDGFKSDRLRPDAFRYRDWVIKALNADMPYDRFLSLQLAGDEIAPGDPDALIATGFYRHYPDEDNATGLHQRRQEILDDITDTVGATFLGLTFGCARCHDHKYDPIRQEDYFRLQAFFAGFNPKCVPLSDGGPAGKHWREVTDQLRKQMESIESKAQQDHWKDRFPRFPLEVRQAVQTPVGKRTPLQAQIAAMAMLQLELRPDEISTRMAKNLQWMSLKESMKSFDAAKPDIPMALIYTDSGPIAPVTYLLKNGSFGKNEREVSPAFPECLATTPEPKCSATAATTGRRRELARWLTQSDHPLTARVLVNRIWHQHFGRGIVGNTSDFGVQGLGPSHPQLLDWLATEFVRSGWSMKQLHRLMVTSATYQRSSVPTESALKNDPENRLYSHANRRRLDAESVRDSMLAVAGVLNTEAFGPGVDAELPAEMGKVGSWPVSKDPRQRNRRSIYLTVRRNKRYPMLEVLDQPDSNTPCAQRNCTTTAPQALMFLNDRIVVGLAHQLAERVIREGAGDRNRDLARVCELCYGRHANQVELRRSREFVDHADAPSIGIIDFCHAVLASNEFLTVD